MSNDRFRAIPSVHELLETPEARALAERTSRAYARERLRTALDEVRSAIAAGALDGAEEDVVAATLARASGAPPASPRPVLNATGVVLHTNLGRAPLSARAIDAVAAVAAGYSDLEYDLERGERGQRDAHGERLLCAMLGCEAAVVANNNAAAVMLVLSTLAEGGEVVVSRGELVEIGGGFRIPEVLERAGCTLREVGTTNRTRVDDYARAITERTRLLLRVHPSNFRIVGFTEQPERRSLVALARERGLPFVEDLGSGCLVEPATLGLADEPTCQASIADGVDVVTFSGDKLLGGPQAGIVAGRDDLVARIRKNPLMRALRVDKMVYAALDATLRAYVEGRAESEVPTLRMLTETAESLAGRAAAFADSLRAASDAVAVTLDEGRSVPGAGSGPGVELPTTLVAIESLAWSADALAGRLRAGSPPVVARVERDRVCVDLRTIRQEDEAALLGALVVATSR